MSANDPIEAAASGDEATAFGPAPARLTPGARPIRADLSSIWDGPAARLTGLSRAVVGRIRGRPFASLAFAIGVGFVVGGALSFRTGRITLAAAVRHIAREVLKQVL